MLFLLKFLVLSALAVPASRTELVFLAVPTEDRELLAYYGSPQGMPTHVVLHSAFWVRGPGKDVAGSVIAAEPYYGVVEWEADRFFRRYPQGRWIRAREARDGGFPPGLLDRAVPAARGFLGFAFNAQYDLGFRSGAVYCSELVWRAVSVALGREWLKPLPVRRGSSVPGVSPARLLNSPELEWKLTRD